MMKRIWSLAAAVFLLVTLTACGANSPARDQGKGASNSTSSYSPAAPSTPAPAPQPAEAPEGAPAAGHAPTASAPASPASAPIPEASDRKIILNAQFDLKVKDADVTIQKLGAIVRGAGGYVQDSRQTGTKQQGRTVTMSMRVPAGQYGPITDVIRSSGEVTSQREWTQDVTSQFVDLTARLGSQEIHLTQLQKLYDKGGTIKEMMDVENEIARVQADIEAMKGNLRVLENQVSYSTITLTLYEPGAPTPIQPPKTLAERISRGFIGSWNDTVNFLGDLVVFIVSALPVLALLVILVGIPGYFIIRAARRRQKPPTPPKQNPPPPFPQ